MKKYNNKPVIVNDLFSSDTHAKIKLFVNEYIPYIPLCSDIYEKDSILKFNRKYAHNLDFFVTIHTQLTEFASEMFNEKVKPSYTFLSLYEDGGQCPLHLDRPQCRYTIDYLIQQDDTAPWPLNVSDELPQYELAKLAGFFPDTEDEVNNIIENNIWNECLLAPNDAACYSGTSSWHYRPTKSKGKVALAFFHFVPESFNGPLA